MLYIAQKLTLSGMSQGYFDWFLETEGEKLPLVFTDSGSALALAKPPVVTKKSKHIDLRYHHVRDHVKDLCFCPGEINRADSLTKPLVSGKYISVFKTTPEEQHVASVKCCYVAEFGFGGSQGF